MADISDSELFDSTISGTKIEQEAAPAPVVEQPAQNRDEGGRFSAKQEASAAETPAETAQTPQETHPEAKGGVPVGAVQAERQKRQAAEADAEALRREIAELRGMVTAIRQPAQQQPQEQKAPASIWDDPDAYLSTQIAPVQQQAAQMQEMLWEMQASAKHGAEAVEAAKEAGKALFGTPEGKALAAKGGNVFDNLVQWHKQQQAYARVGNDPDAWLNSEIEKKLADPAFLAQAMERARGGAQAAVSRSNPVTSMPPTLSRLPAGGNQPQSTPESDDSLFSTVTSSRKRR